MKTAAKIVDQLLETDGEEYTEVRQKLRPETARRIQRAADAFLASGFFTEPTTWLTIGNTRYDKEDGQWYRIAKLKNPKFQAKPIYFVIYPGPGKFTFIAVKGVYKQIRRLFSKAIDQIYRDAILGLKQERYSGMEMTEKSLYDRCVSNKRPEPAYEIFADGTWVRTKTTRA